MAVVGHGRNSTAPPFLRGEGTAAPGANAIDNLFQQEVSDTILDLQPPNQRTGSFRFGEIAQRRSRPIRKASVAKVTTV